MQKEIWLQLAFRFSKVIQDKETWLSLENSILIMTDTNLNNWDYKKHLKIRVPDKD